MKEWKPTKEFQKADFSYNQKKKISESNSKEIQFPKEKKIKAWMPPKIEDLKKENQKPTKKNIENQPVSFLFKESNFDASREYLEQVFLSFFLKSLDVLRNWYWKKSEIYDKKIYAILRSLEKNLLKKVLLSMSSLERNEFIKIYQRNYSLSKTEILSSRKEFIELTTQL